MDSTICNNTIIVMNITNRATRGINSVLLESRRLEK